jgi:hypothetical protein
MARKESRRKMNTTELEGRRRDVPPRGKRYPWSPGRWAISLASLLVASCGHFKFGNGGVDTGDGGVDAAAPCYETNLLGSVCFKQALTEALDVSDPRSIVTSSMVSDSRCTEIRERPGLPTLCILAYKTITIGNTLRATGPNPLVLIAAESISISGSIDVSSQEGGPLGAGARDCSSADTDGPPGQPASPAPDGGGGGAGGSLGSRGGAGGMSGLGAIEGGQPALAMDPTVLVGGCSGGRGGEGVPVTGNGGAAGGFGGGAVYLFAGASITVSGTGQINASGAGGSGGSGGSQSCGGGGGGGSGGMIGLEAPSITVTGAVYANGGGGGGGGGPPLESDSVIPTPGDSGSRSMGPSLAGKGGAGGNHDGGNGGRGSKDASDGTPGENGKTYPQPSGGGGGGGAGVIRVFRTAPGSLGGMISPPAQ